MIREPYQYVQTYIGLPVDATVFAAFPQTISWQGEKLLKKDDFHVTICKGADIFTKARIEHIIGEKKLFELFNVFIESCPIRLLSFSDDFRFVQDDARGRKAIVVRCQMSNLNELFFKLNHEFEIEMPIQPAHVTLYTLQKNIGIHIPSEEAMAVLLIVDIPELKTALANVRLI